jgi:hypothetical protein
MHTETNVRVIDRKGNVVLVDFSRKPESPAPRFPGAGGLRKVSHQVCEIRCRRLAIPACPRYGVNVGFGSNSGLTSIKMLALTR